MSKQCSGTNIPGLCSWPDMATTHQQASEPFQCFGGDTFQQIALQQAASDLPSNEVGDCQQPSPVLLQPAECVLPTHCPAPPGPATHFTLAAPINQIRPSAAHFYIFF